MKEVLAEALYVPKDEFCLMVCLSLGSLSAVCLEMQALQDVLQLAGGTSSSRAAAMQLYCDINPLHFNRCFLKSHFQLHDMTFRHDECLREGQRETGVKTHGILWFAPWKCYWCSRNPYKSCVQSLCAQQCFKFVS